MPERIDALAAYARERLVPGPRGRYAPTPSGPLHLGNARTALIAWLQTRLQGGRFILRIEDLDRPRMRPGAAHGIIADLRWLGLDWDEGPECGGPAGPYDQSRRSVIYAQALERLQRDHLAFECFCSRQDIRRAASAPHGDAEMPVYPGTCRGLSAAERRFKRELRAPAWRFRAGSGGIGFVDRLCGAVTDNLAESVGDFVIRRGDGVFAYQLAVAVDDALMGISDVVRGADLFGSTTRQIALLKALRLPVPDYWHVPLMHDPAGRRMAKRDGSDSIAAFRNAGGRPDELVGQLAASLNLIPSAEAVTPGALLSELDLAGLRQRLIEARAEPGVMPESGILVS